MSAPIVLAEPAALTTREWLSGWLVVAVARAILAVTNGRPQPLTRILRGIQRGARSAECRHTERVHAIVQTVSLRCASPHGCLLRSVAVLLLCRWHGYWVTWRVGVHSPPPSSHTWIEAAGHPVGEPFNPHKLYTPIITVQPGSRSSDDHRDDRIRRPARRLRR